MESNEADGAWVLTDTRGEILDLNSDAARLLGLSRRALISRQWYLFFNGNRNAGIAAARAAATGTPVRLVACLRPRERKPFTVDLVVTAQAHEPCPELLWTVLRVARPSPSDSQRHTSAQRPFSTGGHREPGQGGNLGL